MSNSATIGDVGVKFADILLPRSGVNLEKWATVACDQFSSEKEYWLDVEKFVSGSPSTYNIILPECFLSSDNTKRVDSINSVMRDYVNSGLFVEYKDTVILTKRSNMDGLYRYGIIVSLDLEKYSFDRNSTSLIRATEGTIEQRIPPRVKIREHAILESPHIMVMIDDKKQTIIEPLIKAQSAFDKIYDTPLMKGGGRLEGWVVDDKCKAELEKSFVRLFENSPKDANGNKLLFAVGDGNHSLATAKQCYENLKKEKGEEYCRRSNARYCLVEIENIYDKGIIFEPIHRVLFSFKLSDFDKYLSLCGFEYSKSESSLSECLKAINKDRANSYFAIYADDKYYVYSVAKKGALTTSAKVIEKLIDRIVYEDKAADVDYIHEVEDTIKVAKSNGRGNIGIIMSDISKSEFFPTILASGPFPRKTFSLGSSVEKRYYMECRKIQ